MMEETRAEGSKPAPNLNGCWTVTWPGLSYASRTINVEDGKFTMGRRTYSIDSCDPLTFKWDDQTVQTSIDASERQITWTTTNPEYLTIIWKKCLRQDEIKKELEELMKTHPWLDSESANTSHELHYFVRKCRQDLESNRAEQAQEHLEVVERGVDALIKELQQAFYRFDPDASGTIDKAELVNMCSYLGIGTEEAAKMDLNKDGTISLEEFENHVANAGGLSHLLQLHRERVAMKQFGEHSAESSGIRTWDRVLAHYYVEGAKSSLAKEAQVLAVGVKDKCPDAKHDGVQLLFGFSPKSLLKPDKHWNCMQVVPPSWIASSPVEARYCEAMRDVGILDADMSFWASIFPEGEMEEICELTKCQRAALRHVRQQASKNHEEALPALREKFKKLGYGENDLQNVFTWLEDLAPACIHLSIDKIGRFMETDDYYRNQFETGSSGGAIDDKNQIRIGWEKELFGSCYDDASGHERPKYGALSVMNDYRGITSALQYGDSYVVLKNKRLCLTFSALDSGGIQGKQLGVLDKYAHVLNEYSEPELRGLVTVANANMDPSASPNSSPKLLRGQTTDTSREWVTLGFPTLAQQVGSFYFEVVMHEGCVAPQIGMVSSNFGIETKASNKGVGDDEHSWAVDGMHAARWHNGKILAWDQSWPSSNNRLTEKVTVGIAMDLNAGKLWCATNGVWGATPAFDAMPTGLSMYPAVSLQGPASFNFGPQFAHEPLKKDGSEFTAWPGAPGRVCPCSNPAIGNSEILRCYKEVQIHGAVNFKKHVQRLVANPKYKDTPKEFRQWALKVEGDFCPGLYKRAGAMGDTPIYKCTEGSKGAVIYMDQNSQTWRVNDTEDFSTYKACAPAKESNLSPPRGGWKFPDDKMGMVPLHIFKAVLADIGLSPESTTKLTSAFGGSDQEGEPVAFKCKGGTLFVDEWSKLKQSASADDVWERMVGKIQKEVLDASGIGSAIVLDNGSHPYAAKKHTWSKEVSFEGSAGLKVHFAQQCFTLPGNHVFRIMSGPLTDSTAKEGTAIEVKIFQEVTGKIKERIAGSEASWLVEVDRKKLVEMGLYSSGLTPAITRCGAAVQDAKESQDEKLTCVVPAVRKSFNVNYKDGKKIADEIKSFNINVASAFSPITIGEFSGPGPAQEAGVKEGWFVDILELVNLPQFRELEYEEGNKGSMPPPFGEGGMFSSPDPDVLQKVLDKILQVEDMSITFTNGFQGNLSTRVDVHYDADKKVKSEIMSLNMSYGGDLEIDRFTKAKDPSSKDLMFDGFFYHDFFGGEDHKCDCCLTVTDGGWKSGLWVVPGPCPVEICREGNDVKITWHPGTTVLEGKLQEDGSISGVVIQDGVKGGGLSLQPAGDPVAIARDMGVRERWRLDVDETLAKINTGTKPRLTKEKLMSNPYSLLDLSDVTLVLLPPHGSSSIYECSGGKTCDPEGDPKVIYPVYGKGRGRGRGRGTMYGQLPDEYLWKSLYVKASSVTCELCVEGYNMGEDTPNERWGIFALAVPVEAEQPTQEIVNELAVKMTKATARARGLGEASVTIENEDWDEQRLRALCKRHGWEFEWMTDDGEQQRRIGQRAVMARTQVAKASKKQQFIADMAKDWPDGFQWNPALKCVEQHAGKHLFKYMPKKR